MSTRLISVYDEVSKRVAQIPPEYLSHPAWAGRYRPIGDIENCAPCRDAQEAALATEIIEPVEVEEAPAPKRGKRITEPATDPSGDN